MGELIHIQEQDDGRRAVSAIELYQKLGFDPKNYARWTYKNIVSNPFAIEGEDYVINFIKKKIKPGKGRASQDYALSIEFAKKLAMLARTDKGEMIRQYFIDMENVVVEAVKSVDASVTSDPMEILRQFFKVSERHNEAIEEHRKEIEGIKEEVQALKEKSITRSDWTAIVGYATRIGMPVGITLAAALGRRATKLCRENGVEPEKIHDPRFGFVNTYPDFILEQVFNEPKF